MDPKRLEEQIWEIPGVKRKLFTWYWWFWLFFFSPFEKSKSKPPQLMILYSFKDSPWVTIGTSKKQFHTYKVDPEIRKLGERKIERQGAVASWFYDGKKMHHSYVVRDCPLILEKGATQGGSLQTRDELQGFSDDGKGRYQAHIRNASPASFDLRLEKLSNEYFQPYLKHRNHAGVAEYSVLRINQLHLEGEISRLTGNETCEGIGYFQKVAFNIPAPNWYWGNFFFENGSIFKYFAPHTGYSLFRKGRHDSPRRLENLQVPIKFEMEFYDRETEFVHKFGNIKVAKYFGPGGLPIWKVSGVCGKKELRATAKCYARTCYELRGPFPGLKMRSSALYYNELPTVITFFSYDGFEKKIGRGIGNTEHAWGILP